MGNIHSTAIIANGAQIADDVQVGPYCVIGAQVKIASKVKLHSHVIIEGDSKIGTGSEIFPFSTIGLVPQDLKYNGEPGRVVIGKNNKIREHVTVHIGTEGGGMFTRIGDNNLIMIGAHVAHDCLLGNNNVIANSAALAGHVQVGNHVIIGGLSGVHQFVRIGDMAMIGGMSALDRDVPPFCTVAGNRARFDGLNLVGLRRAKADKAEIKELKSLTTRTFDRSYDDTAIKSFWQAQLPKTIDGTLSKRFLDFLLEESSRGLIKGSNDR